jgi:hypothetical protein
MVELATVPDRVVTSTAPTSSVSRGDIQQNADLMAGAINKVADATMSIAEKQAKEQAANDLQQQKVTRDADGNVTVANPANSVIFGRAGDLYHAAVAAGTIAQHSNIISSEMNDFHQKNPADPAAFTAAADAWKTRYLADHGGGEVGIAIRQQADQVQTQHYNAITDRAASADLATNASAIAANQQSARDDVMAMMRGGANLEDPAVQGKIRQFDASTETRSSNPLFGYSKEQAQLDRENFHSAATANRFLYKNDQIYKSQGEGGGYEGAMEAAKDILTNPAYKMSQQDRESYYHKATADIRANEAIRRQDLGEARAAFNELTIASAGGRPIDSDQVEQVAKAFRAAGSPDGAARVYAAFIRKPLNDDFGKQPLSVQTSQLMGLQGANAAAAAHRFFVGKGYTPEQSAGIVGNLVHESGLDASAAGDIGPDGKPTSGGLAQFHNERLDALRAFAAERGKPATDFTTQLEFIDKELNSTEGATRAKLLAAKTPEEAAAAFIHYERPAGYTPENPAAGLGYQSRQSFARTVFNGRPADASMGPAGSAWLEVNRQRTLDTAAQAQWETIMADYKATGTRPAPQAVTDIVNAARVSRNAGFLETIAHDTARMDIARDLSQSPLPIQSAALTTMEAAGAAGELSPGHAALLKDLQKRNTAITKGLEENPISTIVQNFPDKLKPPGPLDFSTAGALAGSIANRAAIAQFGASNWNTAPLSILDQADIKQVRAALQGPQGGTVLTTMANVLKPDEMNKLLDAKEFRDSVVGMQASIDEPKMTASNSVVEKLWRANPALAESSLGAKSIERMQAWQALKDTFEAPELAKMLNRADDPGLAQARKDAVKAANDETEKLSPADMAYRLGTGRWLTGRITGNTPDVPLDSNQGAALVNDYRAAYAQLRANGVPADLAAEQATKRLQSTWGISQAAGNRLMKNGPEMSPLYPAINGNKDWISDQLKGWVIQRLGPEMTSAQRSIEGIGIAGNDSRWTIEGIVSDARTATERNNNVAPSYLVAVKGANGFVDVLPERITFDPSKYIAAHEADLRHRQNEASINQWAHGGDRGDFMNTGRQFHPTDRPSYLFGEALPE